MKDFKRYFKELHAEHLNNTNGINLTLEFATNEDNMEEKLEFIKEHKCREGFKWVTRKCRTCFEHNAHTPIHVEVIKGEIK